MPDGDFMTASWPGARKPLSLLRPVPPAPRVRPVQADCMARGPRDFPRISSRFHQSFNVFQRFYHDISKWFSTELSIFSWSLARFRPRRCFYQQPMTSEPYERVALIQGRASGAPAGCMDQATGLAFAFEYRTHLSSFFFLFSISLGTGLEDSEAGVKLAFLIFS